MKECLSASGRILPHHGNRRSSARPRAFRQRPYSRSVRPQRGILSPSWHGGTPVSHRKKIIKTLFFPKKIKQVNLDRTKVYENPVLQGACYIFSKDFIQARNYAFYPETFLYFEEDILHLQCQQQNLKMLYVPNIQIKHLEDVSTNMILKTNLSKEKMKSENLIHSMTAFINLTTPPVCPNEQGNKKQR